MSEQDYGSRKLIAALGGAILALAAVWNVWAASRIGAKAGYSLAGLLGQWFAGFEPDQTYPGLMLMALERLQTAGVLAGLLLISIVWVATARRSSR